jgi:FkbM family methyltransferase
LKEFNINSLTKEKNQNNILELCKNSEKSIVLMPAGQHSIILNKYLNEHSINIDYFVDNDEEKQGIFIQNTPVISFPQFKKISYEKFLIVATNEHIQLQIVKQLKKHNIKNYICLIPDYLIYSTYEIENAKEIICNNFEKYIKLYEMLEDDLSKKTLVNKLNYLITFDNKYLKDIVRPYKNQYFERDIHKVSANDYFVDCGAYTGDTLENLMNITNSNIAGYYGFEPADINLIKLIEKTKLYENLEICKKGLWDKDEILSFDSTSNSASKLDANGDIKIEVVTLDNQLKDKKITFIKMDIEGAEYEALLGAKNIIISQNPILAISAYHKFDDIYRLAFLIESFGVNYKYYLRHYTMGVAETVLYGVPK